MADKKLRNFHLRHMGLEEASVQLSDADYAMYRRLWAWACFRYSPWCERLYERIDAVFGAGAYRRRIDKVRRMLGIVDKQRASTCFAGIWR